MDRRRAVALILGLVLCLALLGAWVVRFDKDAAPAESPDATEPGPPRKPVAEIVQIPREASEDPGTASYEAPIGPGVFRGRVIDAATRQPVREFTVEVHPPRQGGRPDPSPISRSFQTDDGRFVYRGLPAGISTVYTTASGYQRFDMQDVRISTNEPGKEILIPMRAGHVLRGRVIDELTRDPIASATVSFREGSVKRFEGNFRMRPSVRSGKDGSFVLDGAPAGAVRIEVSALNYAGKETETFVSAKMPPLEIALSKGGVISGYMAGADGISPVAGQISIAYLDEDITISTSTGSAGEFSFTRLNAGRYQLVGHSDGLNGQREIDLAHNEQLEGIVLAMSAGHSIRGVVSGLRPEERANADLYVFAEGSRTGLGLQANLDERGKYEVRGVAPGTVRIQASAAARGVVTKVVRMPADGDLTVDLEFKAGARLSGRVTVGGKPLAGVMLRPHYASPDAQSELYLQPSITGKNGEYAYEDVPNGDYVFMIESFASPIARVSGDTVFDIDVPDVQLSGHVFEEGSKVPVVGARITLRSLPLRMHPNRLGDNSNNFGQFGIRGLQPGDFMLSTYKSGYELYRTTFSYGSPVADMTIYLRPARGVEIKVREAGSNKAIDNVLVVEILEHMPGIAMTLHTDPSGIGYLPSGLAGSSLRISAAGYHVLEVTDWNGEQLDASLQREALP